MDSTEIISLWLSSDENSRIKALAEVLVYEFDGFKKVPEWARKLLSHAAFLDMRQYESGYQIWIEAILVADKVCAKYGWPITDIHYTDAEFDDVNFTDA